MEVLIFTVTALLGFTVGWGMGNALAIKDEGQLMAQLVKLRADRYIAAVAKVKVEEEVQASAKVQATERLTQQGVTPTKL